jgi:hypothetical protein
MTVIVIMITGTEKMLKKKNQKKTTLLKGPERRA